MFCQLTRQKSLSFRLAVNLCQDHLHVTCYKLHAFSYGALSRKKSRVGWTIDQGYVAQAIVFKGEMPFLSSTGNIKALKKIKNSDPNHMHQPQASSFLHHRTAEEKGLPLYQPSDASALKYAYGNKIYNAVATKVIVSQLGTVHTDNM